MIRKISPLLLAEVLGAKRLTADGMYPVQDCENLQLQIQMQLSQKRKSFTGFFIPFLESTSNFKHFERKDAFHNKCISGITDCKNLA